MFYYKYMGGCRAFYVRKLCTRTILVVDEYFQLTTSKNTRTDFWRTYLDLVGKVVVYNFVVIINNSSLNVPLLF